MNQTNNRIREEFRIAEVFGYETNQVWGIEGDNIIIQSQNGERIDSLSLRQGRVWLAKIAELLKSQRNSYIERIKKVKEAVRTQTGSFKYDNQYDDCIKIIEEDK